MSGRKRKKRGKQGINKAALAASVIATAIVLFSVCGGIKLAYTHAKSAFRSLSASYAASHYVSAQSAAKAIGAGSLEVNFIDVGQGDGILLRRDGHGMLIDAGTEDAAVKVTDYIKSQGLSSLDYAIGTHPHEDHIGGMDNVIKAFNINLFMMPDVTTNTKSFSDVLTAAQKKGLKITRPAPGKTYDFEGATFTVLAPNSAKYNDLNNYSIVIRLVYGSESFLFEGDAQTQSEQEMLQKGFTLKSDVLKVGHHGSKTSTSAAFLKAVSPKYAVISVGKGNVYGLPAQTTVSRLQSAGIKLYRTDQNGTVTAVTDGKTVSFKTEKAS